LKDPFIASVTVQESRRPRTLARDDSLLFISKSKVHHMKHHQFIFNTLTYSLDSRALRSLPSGRCRIWKSSKYQTDAQACSMQMNKLVEVLATTGVVERSSTKNRKQLAALDSEGPETESPRVAKNARVVGVRLQRRSQEFWHLDRGLEPSNSHLRRRASSRNSL